MIRLKALILFPFTIICFKTNGQLTLTNFLANVARHSNTAKILENHQKVNEIEFLQSQKTLRPTVTSRLTLPTYSKSVTPIQQPDGRYEFYEIESFTGNVDLSISQPLPLGGNIGISTGLRHFSVSDSKYYAGNIGINYLQDLTFIDKTSGRKKSAQLAYKYETIQHTKAQLRNQNHAKDLFFQILIEREKVSLYNKEVESLQHLLSRIRETLKNDPSFRLDSIEVGLRLNRIVNHYDHSKEHLETLIKEIEAIACIKVDSPQDLILPLEVLKQDVSYNQILEKYNQNVFKPTVDLNLFKYQQTLKEKRISKFSGASLAFGMGINNSNPVFRELAYNFKSSYSANLSLSIPIVDWGASKSQYSIAKIQMESALLDVTELKHHSELKVAELLDIRHELVAEYSFLNQETQLNELKLIKAERFYATGKIEFEKLSEAVLALHQSSISKLKILQNLWSNYFELSEFTLEDN